MPLKSRSSTNYFDKVYGYAQASREPMSFYDWLYLMIIGLKFCGVINWPWFWILIPGPAVFLIMVLIAVIIEVSKKVNETN